MIRLIPLFFIAVMGIMLPACVSTQKAVYLLKKRNQLAYVCYQNYPVRDSITYQERVVWDTAYIPFDSVLVRDTCIYNGNILVHSSKIPCPPNRVITKTIFRDSIIYRKDSAQISYLENQTAKCEAEKKDIERSVSLWRKWALIELAVIVFLFALLYVKINLKL